MNFLVRSLFEPVRCAGFVLLGLILIAQPARAALDKANQQLSDVVAMGLKRAFSIDSQRLQLEQAKNSQWISYSALMPALSLTSSRTYAGTSAYDLNGNYSYLSGTTDQLRLTAKWTVWDGYNAITNIKASTLELHATKVQSNITVQSFILKLLQSYLSYELLLTQRDTLAAKVEQSDLTNEESQVLVKAGAKTSIDAMDSEIQLANDERDLLELDNNIVKAQRDLLAFINADAIKTLPRLDLLAFEPYYMKEFEQALVARREKIERDLPDLNPDLRKARLELEKQRVNLTQAELGYWPITNISLMHELNLDNIQAQNPTGAQIPTQDYAIALTLTWQFWDWLGTPYKIQNSQKDFDIAVNTYHDTNTTTLATVGDTIAQIDVLDKTIATSRAVVQKAETQLKYAQDLYRLGRISLLVMQQSTNRVTDARNQLATRLSSRYNLAAQFMYAIGEPLTPPDVSLAWGNE